MLTQNPVERITLQGISQHPWLRSITGGNDEVIYAADVAATTAALATLSPIQQHSSGESPMPMPAGTTEGSQNRPVSFTFAPTDNSSRNTLLAKTTPVTPKVVVLNASAPPSPFGRAGMPPSPTVSPPPSVPTPSRSGADRVVPMTPGKYQQGEGQFNQVKSASRIGGLCRMWFGGNNSSTGETL